MLKRAGESIAVEIVNFLFMNQKEKNLLVPNVKKSFGFLRQSLLKENFAVKNVKMIMRGIMSKGDAKIAWNIFSYPDGNLIKEKELFALGNAFKIIMERLRLRL